MKKAILQALEDRYNAQISEADATIKIYLENSVGIGEHPQHIDEIDKQMQKLVDAQEKLKELQAFKLWVTQKSAQVKNQKDQEGDNIQMKIQKILLELNLLRQQMQEKLLQKLKKLKNLVLEKFKF